MDTVLFVLHIRGLKPLLVFYFRVEENFAGGTFREIPFAVDIIFAGGKFRAISLQLSFICIPTPTSFEGSTQLKSILAKPVTFKDCGY